MTLDLSAYKPVADTLTDATAISGAFTAIENNSNALPISQLNDYPSDATKVLRGDGTWAKPTGYEFDYKEFTSPVSVTAVTEATANSVVTADAVTFDGSTAVWIEFFSPLVHPDFTASSRILNLVLYDGSSSIGQLGSITTPAAGELDAPTLVKRRLTPAAASKTYSVRAYVNGGTGGVTAGAGGAGAYVPGYIRISKA